VKNLVRFAMCEDDDDSSMDGELDDSISVCKHMNEL
jgi:hypothetical protein